MKSQAYLDTKPHYEILDGLRGVAAVMVLIFHIFEIHAGFDRMKFLMGHGYLAVDFFFALSGFVIAYAYDDRWKKMSLGNFFKRRLIRLQPMIIMGMIVGACAFYFQISPDLDWVIHEVPVWKMLLVTLIGCVLFPVGKGLDIRGGWSEMYPTNGPAWSLFYEYIANILYALVLRHLPKMILGALVVIAAGFTIHHTLTYGDLCGGWTIGDFTQIKLALIRLAYPFLSGLLLARVSKLIPIKHAFLLCSLLLIIIFCVPRLGDEEHFWMNGAYESFSIILMFPLIIWLGACGKIEGKKSRKICSFLGDISYPLYITHYPIIYIYMAWVTNNKLELSQSWPGAILAMSGAIAIAYLALRFYDIPVRKWLGKLYLSRK